FKKAIADIGFPAVVKTCRGGYDGKGQVILQSEADLIRAKELLVDDQRLIYEALIEFDCEISLIFTRAKTGEICYFPIAENCHRDHILHMTIAPARISETVASQVKKVAATIATHLEHIGTSANE